MAKYFIRTAATIDMDGIADYIAESNLKQALAFYDEAEEVFSMIGDIPEIGAKVDFIEARTYRMFPLRKFRRYIVFYMIEEGVPVIERVIHSSRDIEAALSEDDVV